eukprot:GHVT01068103.1.p1 GENE.GHVT01068103.1~~GHVT01068103.1.p1  ORF type:complete len:198 (+),score=40.01 GHVT01068103.1:463-1056(+)
MAPPPSSSSSSSLGPFIGRFRLFVGAGTARPSPPIGQTLGPLGINMMNFCNEFNQRTNQVIQDVPIQTTLLPTTDKQYRFWVRSPMSSWFIKRASRCHTGASRVGQETKSAITLKEIYHIARAKSMDASLVGVPTETVCRALVGTARGMGVEVQRELGADWRKRDYVLPSMLVEMRKQKRQSNKQAKRAATGAAKKP